MKNPAKHFCSLIIFVLLAIVSRSIAVASENIYSGVDIGSTHFSGDGPADTQIFLKGQHFSDRHINYGIHAGYQITNWLAVEAAYTDFGHGKQTFKISPGVIFIGKPADTQTLEAKGLTISAVFMHEFFPGFSTFAVLGIANIDYKNTMSGGFSETTGYLFSKNSYRDQGIIYGVGAKYKLNNSLALRTDLRRNDVGDFVLDCVTVGIEYSF